MYTFWALQSFTIPYQNPNPIVVRSSYACLLLFLPFVTSLVHVVLACAHVVFPSSCCFSCACFLSQKRHAFPLWPLAYLQKAPNTDMSLIPSHLIFVCLLNLLGDRLKLFLECCCLCLHVHSLLLECVHYLDCNFLNDQF
jgi:hypothetical protein